MVLLDRKKFIAMRKSPEIAVWAHTGVSTASDHCSEYELAGNMEWVEQENTAQNVSPDCTDLTHRLQESVSVAESSLMPESCRLEQEDTALLGSQL